MTRDPFREHKAEPRTGRMASMRPVIDRAFGLLTEGRRFTPIGIAVSIALPFVIVFGGAYLVLGRDGLVQITSAWGESAEANRALAAKVDALVPRLKAIEDELRVQGQGNATKRIVVLENNQALGAQILVKMNGARFNASFPRSLEGDFWRPAGAPEPVFPLLATDQQWAAKPE